MQRAVRHGLTARKPCFLLLPVPTFGGREVALRSIPQPLPEACAPKLRAALADKDLGVCMAACEVAGKSGDKRFLAPLLELIATENHEWLLRAATNAAVQLGAGFELPPIWADRLGDEHLYAQAFDSLQGPIDVPKGSWSGRTDLSRADWAERKQPASTRLTP